jgi:hypothetical protein
VERDSGPNNDDAPSAFLRPHGNVHVFEAEKIASDPPDISYDFVATEDRSSSSPVIVEQLSRTHLTVNVTIL